MYSVKPYFMGSLLALAVLGLSACSEEAVEPQAEKAVPKPQYTLSRDQTHNKFSSKIPPVITVPSGAVIEAFTEEATDAQLQPSSTEQQLAELSFDKIHPLTGPVYVEGAQPGDVLAVTLHDIEMGDWGYSLIFPGFGFLSEEFTEPYLRTFTFDKKQKELTFSDNITIPFKPFPGVMAVAPATEEMLNTIPPRANGGNLDDPHITVGTTVYLPVFVEGALFSIGDTHAAQGMGEVSGSALEAPMRIVYEVNVIKQPRPYIKEPHYETKDTYAVTAFGTTLDIAARKATRYMIDYLVSEHGLTRNDAYMLCSLAGDLKIAEVVDVPHMLVSMHIPKSVLGINAED